MGQKYLTQWSILSSSISLEACYAFVNRLVTGTHNGRETIIIRELPQVIQAKLDPADMGRRVNTGDTGPARQKGCLSWF